MFTIYVAVALVVGVALETSPMFERQELQTINLRFEVRQWLVWSKKSLERLNLPLLWKYHEAHEIPKQWWAWDYTLSWLLEYNHPPVMHKVVIFNHSTDDEPPRQAINQYPWMKPLLDFPLKRDTVAQMVELLARSGARLIILDNEYPQYTDDDHHLAEVIHNCNIGKYGRPVRVLMVSSVNTSSTRNFLKIKVPSYPRGVLEELEKLEPGQDAVSKYTGMAAIEPDADQVVRRIELRRTGVAAGIHESIVVKALDDIGEGLGSDVPDNMYIDFSSPPNSELYPVRPHNYLLDPDLRESLLHPNGNSDVDLRGAIVFVGDGVFDVHSTPFTNQYTSQRSGTEILAHAMDTISRRSWPIRLSGVDSMLYTVIATMIGGLIWFAWKGSQRPLSHLTPGDSGSTDAKRFKYLLTDMLIFISLIGGTWVVACLVFAEAGLIVPVFAPSIAIGLGTLAAILWEHEREREEHVESRLSAAQEKLGLTQDKYEAELRRQEAEAQTREAIMDKRRRHEFVRRINHDLNAPVSNLNWTIAELQLMELESPQVKDKVVRLVKSSDRLCELIDQLVQSYDYESIISTDENLTVCDLGAIVHDSVDGLITLAEKHGSDIYCTIPDHSLWVMANQLQLTRVVDNLILNAVKHNPAGTRVEVNVDTQSNVHWLSIADNGKGIAGEHLENIFEPGYRVDPGNNSSGQGLGLDIALTLMRQMGGEIFVESTVGKGTTFALQFPVAFESYVHPQSTLPWEESAGSDNPQQLPSAEQMLSGIGAVTGEEAVVTGEEDVVTGEEDVLTGEEEVYTAQRETLSGPAEARHQELKADDDKTEAKMA
jgi:signal transduction histidine kinase